MAQTQTETQTVAAVDNNALFATLIELADDHLILGHRLSEWCGHAPMLEEDLSLPNMALDLIGQARSLYQYAARVESAGVENTGVENTGVESAGRSEDDIAYLRSDRQYTNCLLMERPNRDFAHTMLRQLYFAAFMQPFWQSVADGPDETLAGIAGKAVKEVSYHVRHAGEWVVRLGDGTDESAERMQDAVAALHSYTDEMFVSSPSRAVCVEAGVVPHGDKLRPVWNQTIGTVFEAAKLEVPDVAFYQYGGREGQHTEDFGYLLAELQYLQRAYPGAQW